MAGLLEVMQMLHKIRYIHEKKNDDYASSKSPYENFERSAILAEWFNNPKDKSFTVLIGTKLARLSTLLNKQYAANLAGVNQVNPNNESIEDSFLDLATYCILWASYHQSTKVVTNS